MVPVTYNPQNHVEVLLDLIGQKSRPRLRSAVRSQSDIRWLCHGSAYRKTSYTASGHQLPPHKRRLTRAKSVWWQLIDIVDMISIIMFDMSTHDFACRQEHYMILMWCQCNVVMCSVASYNMQEIRQFPLELSQSVEACIPVNHLDHWEVACLQITVECHYKEVQCSTILHK